MSWTPTLDPGVFIPVRTKDDLPDAVAGVITLPAGTSYQFDGTVDLQGDRLLCAGIVTLAGTSSETARVCSTGLVGGALVTSAYSLPMQNLAFFNCTASVFDLDASANPDQALDWRAVNFVDCPSVGTLKGYGNIIYDSGAFLNASGLVLDGAIQTFGFQTSLLDLHNGAVNPGIRFLNTCTIMRRFRSIFSSFVALPGEVGIQVDDQATFVNNESFILETDNFSGGGTYLSGIDATSNKSLIISCVGVENSADIGDYGMTNNAVITPIAAANTFVKVLGTTVDGDFVAKFDQTIDNRSTYVGSLELFFKIVIVCSISSTNNQVIEVRVAKNGVVLPKSSSKMTTNAGGRAENGISQVITSLTANDYIEVWIANTTNNTDVTVTDMSVIIQRV